MVIRLYRVNDDNRVIDKKLNSEKELSGVQLKDATSRTDPIFTITGIEYDNISKYNYLYFPSQHRYYYIQDVVVLTAKRFELHCHVDVLKTFKADLFNAKNRLSITRSAKYKDIGIVDPELVHYAGMYMDSYRFHKIKQPSGTRKNLLITSGDISTE